MFSQGTYAMVLGERGRQNVLSVFAPSQPPPPAQNNPYAKVVYFRADVLVSSNVLVKFKIVMKGPTGEGLMFGLKANTFFSFSPEPVNFSPFGLFEAASHWVAQAAWNSLCSTGWS